MKLRRRIVKSKSLEGMLSWLLATYIRLCQLTGRWQATGLEELEIALQNGPVILVLWHNRIILSGQHWPKQWGQIKPIHDTAPAGRLAGATMAQFGLDPIAMSSKNSNIVISRTVLREMNQGVSVGLAADGPIGPVQVANPAAIGWARATGRPVFLYAWSANRVKRLKTWDNLLLPLPFSRGEYSFQRWQMKVPRKLDVQTYETLSTDLGKQLDAVAQETDARAGRKIEP
jgi:lysophospholipid acyltransferase (LPLAT)-like uncharacterized protein